MGPVRRHSIFLDAADMKALARLARAEARATGIRVTAPGIVRRLIKAHLRAAKEGKRT
ncbi:MAG: hypothetical protein HY616_04015 [Candidatus Rokubacteria bacterium]|nr:hypothetical protein [Candidatus Rokubacteria bacterium]